MDTSIDHHVLSLLEGSPPQAAKDLVKRSNVYTKSEINSCLYRLLKSGQVKTHGSPPKQSPGGNSQRESLPLWELDHHFDDLKKSASEVFEMLKHSPMSTNDLVKTHRETLSVSDINAILSSLEASKSIKKTRTLWVVVSERDHLVEKLTTKIQGLSLDALKKLENDLSS